MGNLFPLLKALSSLEFWDTILSRPTFPIPPVNIHCWLLLLYLTYRNWSTFVLVSNPIALLAMDYLLFSITINMLSLITTFYT